MSGKERMGFMDISGSVPESAKQNLVEHKSPEPKKPAAKKRATKKKAPKPAKGVVQYAEKPTKPTALKMVNIRLPPDIHQRLRAACLWNNTTMNSVLEAMVEDVLIKLEKQAGITFGQEDESEDE